MKLRSAEVMKVVNEALRYKLENHATHVIAAEGCGAKKIALIVHDNTGQRRCTVVAETRLSAEAVQHREPGPTEPEHGAEPKRTAHASRAVEVARAVEQQLRPGNRAVLAIARRTEAVQNGLRRMNAMRLDLEDHAHV